jgi:hypothetical protein
MKIFVNNLYLHVKDYVSSQSQSSDVQSFVRPFLFQLSQMVVNDCSMLPVLLPSQNHCAYHENWSIIEWKNDCLIFEHIWSVVVTLLHCRNHTVHYS